LADVTCHFARIMSVVERTEPEGAAAVEEHGRIQNLEAVQHPVDAFRYAPVGHALVLLDLALARHPFRIGHDLMALRQTAPDLVIDDRKRVVELGVRQRNVGVRINLGDAHGHGSGWTAKAMPMPAGAAGPRPTT